jgi:hypothetical protein
MMHGSNASVSATGSPGSAALSKHNHLSSRPKSAAGSSAGTIKRAGSLSSPGNSVRNSVLPMGSQSPGDTSLIALRIGGGTSRRRRSSALDPFENPTGEGMGNLNRWSQSTDASAHSPATRRKRASSIATLSASAPQPMSPPKAARQLVDHSPRSSPHRKVASGPLRQYVPSESSANARRQVSNPVNSTHHLKNLPQPYAARSHTDAEDSESPSTTYRTTSPNSGLITPSTQSSYAQDYFGGSASPSHHAKDERPSAVRTTTAPEPALNYSRLPRSEALQESAHRRRQSEMFGATDSERSGTAMSNTNSIGERRPRTREKTEKDKKAMLSKALQKANTAVLLDNAQNFEAALEAYSDACRLLQQVMDRSSGAEDKRKLDAIKITYTTRIEELQELEESRPPTRLERELPPRPMSEDDSVKSPMMNPPSPVEESNELAEEPTVIETARMTRIVDVPQLSNPIISNRDSFFSRTLADVERAGRNSNDASPTRTPVNSSRYRQSVIQEDDNNSTQLSPPDNPRNTYMPAPLLPRKTASPTLESSKDFGWGSSVREEPSHEADDTSRDRTESNASVSWLDTIDESGSSDTSSVHSMTSENGLHRKHIRNQSGETDPDFDAAFDAAVEAAYNEGLEPDLDGQPDRETIHARARPESELLPLAAFGENVSPRDLSLMKAGLDDDDDDEEEEERILNEFTQDYGHGFKFDLESKSALPRQSDSSGYSRSTWQSSQVSDRNTAGSSLSTVPEDLLNARFSGKPASIVSSVNTVRADAPPGPPPTSALPRPPSPTEKRMSASVRSRRLSGQNMKQLRIETSTARPVSRKRASTFHHSPGADMTDEEQRNRIFGSDVLIGAPLEQSTSDAEHEEVLRSPPSIDIRGTVSRTDSSEIDSIDEHPGELRPSKPSLFRKNKSSISLREYQGGLPLRDDSDHTVSTPMSATFATLRPKQSMEPLTSQRTTFAMLSASAADGHHINGTYLFDTSISATHAPSSPRSSTEASQPPGLEPCPESSLLRPFWLMRAIGSSITHTRGGFVTTRLFVPHDVWQTRGVKLKSLDEKVANIDLLTAALGRIAGVDTYDADAVMEELQGFEEVMERVQATLTKKLGSDVGVHGSMSMFRDASSAGTNGVHTTLGSDSASGTTDKAAKSNSGKSYLSSWRKLRSKSSGTPLSSTSKPPPAATIVVDKGESHNMASVPMTSWIPVERRGQKAAPNLKAMAFEGPQKEYMGSLARLVQGMAILGKSLFSFPFTYTLDCCDIARIRCAVQLRRVAPCITLNIGRLRT